MQKIAESELILNSRGAVYHLDLRPEELADTVILVGDPGRVEKVSAFFDHIEHRSQHREFISHTGTIGKKRLTCLSTGIGPDNIDIAINELDALINIDLTTRMIRDVIRPLHIVRFGTSGSLQSTIPVDSFVASTHGLGLDNLLNFYDYERTTEETEIIHAFIAQTDLNDKITNPYVFAGSQSLLDRFGNNFHKGITVTCPGFYGPQGRVLRLRLKSPLLIDKLTDFRFNELKITNFEMETSAIFGLGRLLGHECMSINAIIANRVNRQFSANIDATIERLVRAGLEVLAGL